MRRGIELLSQLKIACLPCRPLMYGNVKIFCRSFHIQVSSRLTWGYQYFFFFGIKLVQFLHSVFFKDTLQKGEKENFQNIKFKSHSLWFRLPNIQLVQSGTISVFPINIDRWFVIFFLDETQILGLFEICRWLFQRKISVF